MNFQGLIEQTAHTLILGLPDPNKPPNSFK